MKKDDHSSGLSGKNRISLLASPLRAGRCRKIAGEKEERTATGSSIGGRAVPVLSGTILFVGVVLTFWGFSLSREYSREVAKIRFEAMAEKLVGELDRRMGLPIYGLNGAAGIYASSKSVDRLEFRAYVSSRDLPREFPGALGFGFIQKVQREDLDSFLRSERADHAPDFDIFPRNGSGDLYVIKYVDPMETNRKAWGFNAGSEPVRRAAIDRAIRTGLPALTARVALFQAKKEEAGFLWLVPVYENGKDVSTPEARRAAVQGLVFAPVVLDKVFDNIMAETDGMLDVEIFEGSKRSSSHLLLDADRILVGAENVPGSRAYGGRLFHLSRQIRVGGQTWTCVITTTPKFEAGMEKALPVAVAIAGPILTGALALLFWSLGNSRARAVSMAEKMTENLRLSEAEARKLAVVASRTDNAVVITDAEGCIDWTNNGFTKITGYELEEVRGKRPASFLHGPETDPEAAARMQEGLAGGNGFNLEIVNYGKSGRPYWLAVEAQPLRDEAGKLTGFMTVESDITERKRSEKELLEAKQAAEAANRAKSEFLAMMSHEIRTPMNGVIGMTSLLLDTPQTTQQKEYTEIIRSSGETLLSLINDILDFSKIESGKFELESAVFNVRECVEAVLDLLAVGASRKNLDLLYEITDGVPMEVKGDVTRVRQILVNLVGNALKFTPRGEVEVSVRPEKGEQGNTGLLFAVRDTGIGIPPEARQRLFQPFSQVDASTTRKYGGTGLGLAISKKLAELMGGRLWVEEGPEGGSVFFFTVQVETVPSSARPYISSSQQQLKGRRLLLVDDNATNLRILSSYADKWGMKTVAVEAGSSALKILEDGETFDFVIMDMQMPEMDGVMLAREVRKCLGPVTPPLLLLSSLGLSERAHEEGLFAASLTKPVKPGQIYQMLVKIAGKERVPAPVVPEKRVLQGSSPFGQAGILLAEDNHVNQKVALAMLSNLGCMADVAGNGLEVLDAFKRQEYDIIFMDMQMPEMDGLEATRKIRTLPGAGEQKPWIIALTANAMAEDRDLCLAAGMNDYLSKPIKKEALAAALERALLKK